MIQRLSEMLRSDDAATRRHGIELAEVLSERGELAGLLAGEGETFPSEVRAALMLRLSWEVSAPALMLTLPFNLPDLPRLAQRPQTGGLYIIESEATRSLPAEFLPPRLSRLTLYYLRSAVLLQAVLQGGPATLSELNLDQIASGLPLDGLAQLSTLRTLSVRSSPGVHLTALPPALSTLRLEGVGLVGEALQHADGVTALHIKDCDVDGALQLPAPGRVRSLELEGLGLLALPTGTLLQPDLTRLSLTRNRLVALPEAIWTLANLETLLLSDNRLIALPSTIGQLVGLRELDLSGNRLTALPADIAALQGLEVLGLAGNPLTDLPDAVATMQSLKRLSLGQTGLTRLPGCLAALPALEELDARGLRIRPFPPPPAFPALRRIRIDRALEGAAHQWSRQRIRHGLPGLVVQ